MDSLSLSIFIVLWAQLHNSHGQSLLYQYHDGKIYNYTLLGPASYDNAKLLCHDLRGRLPVTITAIEQDYSDKIGAALVDVNVTDAWFGLRHDAVEWIWDDGNGLDFPDRWAEGEPVVLGCAYLVYNETRGRVTWKTDSCSTQRAAVCEIISEFQRICDTDLFGVEHCFEPSKKPGSWQETRDQCQKDKGDLAVTQDEDLQDFLDVNWNSFALVGINTAWFGLKWDSSKWTWINNEAQGDPDRWEPGYGNRTGCGHVSFTSGPPTKVIWKSENCTYSQYGLCEYITDTGLPVYAIVLIVLGAILGVAGIAALGTLVYCKCQKKTDIDPRRNSDISMGSMSGSSSSSRNSSHDSQQHRRQQSVNA